MNQSTLRHWTARGRVPFFLTPGGHRRYREADLLALTEPGTVAETGAGTPLANALLASHDRYESVARRVLRSSTWSRQFDDDARRRFRLLGSSMLRLLSSYVVSVGRPERERCLRRGRALATEYGQAAVAMGLSATEATEAFVVFRRPVLELVQQWLGEQPRYAAESGDPLRRVNHFMDEILVSLVSAYEGQAAGRSAAPEGSGSAS